MGDMDEIVDLIAGALTAGETPDAVADRLVAAGMPTEAAQTLLGAIGEVLGHAHAASNADVAWEPEAAHAHLVGMGAPDQLAAVAVAAVVGIFDRSAHAHEHGPGCSHGHGHDDEDDDGDDDGDDGDDDGDDEDATTIDDVVDALFDGIVAEEAPVALVARLAALGIPEGMAQVQTMSLLDVLRLAGAAERGWIEHLGEVVDAGAPPVVARATLSVLARLDDAAEPRVLVDPTDRGPTPRQLVTAITGGVREGLDAAAIVRRLEDVGLPPDAAQEQAAACGIVLEASFDDDTGALLDALRGLRQDGVGDATIRVALRVDEALRADAA